MPKPAFRSRTFRRVYVKTPGGRTVLHHIKRLPGLQRCGRCGDFLKGVPRLRPARLAALPKSKKRAQRPFGGVLCPSCAREALKAAARGQAMPGFEVKLL